MAAKNVVQFLTEVRIELAKVIWPKYEEFMGSTLVVLFLVCVFAIYLGVIDVLCARSIGYILSMY